MSGSVPHPFRSRAYAAAAAAGLVLALAGCGDDDPKAGAEETPSASPSPTEASSEASPTEDASASVTPATGVLLDMPHATINAPKGWKQLEDFLDFGTEANPPTGTGAVRLTQLEFPGPEISVDLQAKAALQGRLGDMLREPDVEIAGLTFYHLSGKPNKDSHLDTFGVLNDGYQTGIDFEFENKVPEAERQQIIDESLATFTWR